MFKIISKQEYYRLKNEAESYFNMYNDGLTSLTQDNIDYELKIADIYNKIVDIVNDKKMQKEKIYQKLIEILKSIEGGKNENKNN